MSELEQACCFATLLPRVVGLALDSSLNLPSLTEAQKKPVPGLRPRPGTLQIAECTQQHGRRDKERQRDTQGSGGGGGELTGSGR